MRLQTTGSNPLRGSIICVFIRPVIDGPLWSFCGFINFQDGAPLWRDESIHLLVHSLQFNMEKVCINKYRVSESYAQSKWKQMRRKPTNLSQRENTIYIFIVIAAINKGLKRDSCGFIPDCYHIYNSQSVNDNALHEYSNIWIILTHWIISWSYKVYMYLISQF